LREIISKADERKKESGVVENFISQYALWIKKFFGVDKGGVITEPEVMKQFLKEGYCGENEHGEMYWQLVKDYEDVDADRRVLVKTTFTLSKINE